MSSRIKFKIFFSLDWEQRHLYNPFFKKTNDYIKSLIWGWELIIHTPSLHGPKIINRDFTDSQLQEMPGWDLEWGWESKYHSEYSQLEKKTEYKKFNKGAMILDMENISSCDLIIGMGHSSVKTACELSYAIAKRKPIIYFVDESEMLYQNDNQHIDHKSIYYPFGRLFRWEDDILKPYALSRNRWLVKDETELRRCLEVELLKISGTDIDQRTYGPPVDGVIPKGIEFKKPDTDETEDSDNGFEIWW